MLDQKIYDTYVEILKTELVPAMGCTEPIALAYAAAKAREVLGAFPDHADAYCSGNIIKNVKGVKVPNSDGMMGVEAAVVLGMTGGDASRSLEVLESVTKEDIARTKELLENKICSCHLEEGVANLYLTVVLKKGEESAEVTIENAHTNITRIVKNGAVLFEKEKEAAKKTADKSLLNMKDIVAFAEEVKLADVEEVLSRQVEYNTAISEEGLRGSWGAEVGRTILESYGDDIKYRAAARAAAGSDARMSGCALPVIINSGSGNQGMTCSLPVIEYAKELGKSREDMLRALCISDLIALDQKRYIGPLSAYCGAVCAGAGAGAAITWLSGGTQAEIENTVVNTIANVGGIICDGAKSSCAAKISAAVQAAILGHQMAMKGRVFGTGEGIVMDTPEDTVKAVGYVGRVGMKQTDVEVLNLMIGKADPAL